MKYFKDIRTLEEARKEYRRLLKINHPDNGGSEEATKEINREYDELLKNLQSGRTYASKEEAEQAQDVEQEVKEAIQRVAHLDIDIEIIGSWVWLSGNTYSVKDVIKSAGFKWANNKKMWYFHAGEYHKRSKKAVSIDDIRQKYGSTSVHNSRRYAIG